MNKLQYDCDVCHGTIAIALRDPDDLTKRSSEITVVREYVIFLGSSICKPCYETIKTQEPMVVRKLGTKMPVTIKENSSNE